MDSPPVVGQRYLYDNGVAVVDEVDHEHQLAEMHDANTGIWRIRHWHELYPEDG